MSAAIIAQDDNWTWHHTRSVSSAYSAVGGQRWTWHPGSAVSRPLTRHLSRRLTNDIESHVDSLSKLAVHHRSGVCLPLPKKLSIYHFTSLSSSPAILSFVFFAYCKHTSVPVSPCVCVSSRAIPWWLRRGPRATRRRHEGAGCHGPRRAGPLISPQTTAGRVPLWNPPREDSGRHQVVMERQLPAGQTKAFYRIYRVLPRGLSSPRTIVASRARGGCIQRRVSGASPNSRSPGAESAICQRASCCTHAPHAIQPFTHPQGGPVTGSYRAPISVDTYTHRCYHYTRLELYRYMVILSLETATKLERGLGCCCCCNVHYWNRE